MTARRGVALLLVLWLVVVLGGIGGSVAMAVRARLHVASNLRDRAVGRAAAESGIVEATQAIEDSLARLPEGRPRSAFLNALEQRGEPAETLADGRFRVSYEDVSTRLDVNLASEEQLARFFAQFTGSVAARDVAREIRALTRADAGPGVVVTPLLSLDALRRIASLDPRTASAASAFLTVDGDGSVNMAHAAPAVRLAVAGQVVDAPTRLLVRSRGTRAGSRLVHEIEAVLAVQGAQLALVRWRERDL